MRARDTLSLASNIGIVVIAFFGLVIPELVATLLVNASLLGIFSWGVITLKDTTVKAYERLCGLYVSLAIVASFAVYYLIAGPAEGIKFNLFLLLIISSVYISFGLALFNFNKYISKIEDQNK